MTITWVACGHPTSPTRPGPCRLCRLFHLEATDAYVLPDHVRNLEWAPRVPQVFRDEWRGREAEANAWTEPDRTRHLSGRITSTMDLRGRAAIEARRRQSSPDPGIYGIFAFIGHTRREVDETIARITHQDGTGYYVDPALHLLADHGVDAATRFLCWHPGGDGRLTALFGGAHDRPDEVLEDMRAFRDHALSQRGYRP